MAMLLLLRRPIRRYRFGSPPKRTTHHYRVLNLRTNHVQNATYRGTPKSMYSYSWTVTRALAEGWQVYKPNIGLPDGA